MMPMIAHAAAPVGSPVYERGLLGDMRRFAQMRPRQCTASVSPTLAAPGWQSAATYCAWQGHLVVRSWTAPSQAADGCVDPGASWWRWMQDRYAGSAFPSSAWYAAWTTQAVGLDGEDTRILAIVARTEDGSWMAREWQWNPSERAPTRRWQQNRWDLLAAEANALRREIPGDVKASRSRPLMSAWLQSIGKAPAEVTGNRWRWLSGGRCLTIDSVGVNETSFQLPYQVEDNRHEQRSAMQLLLARRNPGATWIRAFSLTDASRQSKNGLARFKAVWRESDMILGQLWIPTKRDGSVLSLRLSAAEKISGGAKPDSVSPAAQMVEEELERLSKLVGNVDG